MPKKATITVIIPTIGRDTLDDALASCVDADEIVLVYDDASPRNETRHLTIGNMRITGVWGGDMGYTARNLGIQLATSNYLAFLDDDDQFLPGALDTMRAWANPDRPTIFRMDHPDCLIWRQPILEYGNVGTPMILVPNIPHLLGSWEEHQDGTGGDYRFLKGCIVKMGKQPEWVDQVTSVVRPHDRPGVVLGYAA